MLKTSVESMSFTVIKKSETNEPQTDFAIEKTALSKNAHLELI